MAPKPKATVIQFRSRPDFEGEDELPVGLPPSSSSRPRMASASSAIVLTDKPKVWFAIGPGRSGKTMLLRWAAEMSANQGGAPIVAAADPQNRSLKNYLDNVAEPPTNDATATSRWLEALLRHVMEEKTSALVDLGGGDTALHKLLTTVPDLTDALDGAGVAPVAAYTLGPRVRRPRRTGILRGAALQAGRDRPYPQRGPGGPDDGPGRCVRARPSAQRLPGRRRPRSDGDMDAAP